MYSGFAGPLSQRSREAARIALLPLPDRVLGSAECVGEAHPVYGNRRGRSGSGRGELRFRRCRALRLFLPEHPQLGVNQRFEFAANLRQILPQPRLGIKYFLSHLRREIGVLAAKALAKTLVEQRDAVLEPALQL